MADDNPTLSQVPEALTATSLKLGSKECFAPSGCDLQPR